MAHNVISSSVRQICQYCQYSQQYSQHSNISLVTLFTVLICTISNPTLSASLNQFSGSTNYAFLKHANYNKDGYASNIEKGWLPGVQVSISNTAKRLTGTFSLETYGGDVNFDQQLTSGIVNSKTTEQLTRFFYRLDYRAPRKWYQFYAVTSFNNWQRKVQPNDSVIGLNRQYQWWVAEAGIQIEIYDSPRNTIQADFGISHDFKSEMLLDLTHENLGKPLLKLDSKPGGSINFVFNHRFTRKHSGELFAKAKYWQFGESNTRTVENDVQTASLKENESQSLTTVIGAAYYYSF